MNTLNFLDAHVLLALLWSRHVHAERARSWFEQAGEEQFILCRFTQLTVLPLLTFYREDYGSGHKIHVASLEFVRPHLGG